MIALLLALQAVAVAPAAASDVEADLRCVAVLSFAVSRATPEQRSGLMAGTMYFVGRIDAQRPSYDYQRALVALASDPAKLGALAADGPRCGEIMRKRSGELQQLGDTLKAIGAARKSGVVPSR